MKDFLSEEYLAAVGADLVIEDRQGNTYVCELDRSKAVSGTEIEQQGCWQIKRVSETENNGVKEVRIMYPNGSKRFEFAPSQADTYTYEYGI